MGAWKNAFFLQEKPMSIKFLLLRGLFFWGGGGSADFIFYGREDFSEEGSRTITRALLNGGGGNLNGGYVFSL